MSSCIELSWPAGNYETTPRNPSDVTLDFVLDDLLTYFNDLKILRQTKKEIEKKYNINKECNDFWPEDDIKRAWGKTQRINDYIRRNRWALVIMLQVLKRQRRKEESDLNEGEHLAQRCTELSLNDTPDDTSSAQSSAAPNKVVGEDMQPRKRKHRQTVSVSQDQTEPLFQAMSQTGETLGSRKKNTYNVDVDNTICIRIPVTEMFGSGPGVNQRVDQPVQSSYKLIDGSPFDTNIREKKSYVMSFNNETGNAEWVYEILNKETLTNNCKKPGFGNDYVKGHLAAAANHRWCWEANNDAYLFSNMIPQNRTLNNSTWKKMEKGCRDKIRNPQNDIRNVHVYTGPLYLETSYRLQGKVVPTHLYKVIIDERRDGTVVKPKCYVIPNFGTPEKEISIYEKDIDYIERVSRLRFIEHRPNVNMRDYIKTVTLQGESVNEEPCRVDMKVGMC